ncbi:unnamed protein product [Amoebophrya sp. A120]|nr:unnamed protein product [Amoebophrya sp. A120]|eukprot:GSA120T00025069001.1
MAWGFSTCFYIEKIYAGSAVRLKTGSGKLTEKFAQKCGIRQGSSLSPLLFILCLGFAMEMTARVLEKQGVWKEGADEVEKLILTWIGYVDDIATKAGNEEQAREVLLQLTAACAFVGLRINSDKTECMTFNIEPKTRDNEEAREEEFLWCDETGQERGGWMVEWDGADLREDTRRAARKATKFDDRGLRVTHLLMWNDGSSSRCHYKGNGGWAVVQRGKKQESIRLVRLGDVKFVLEDKNKFQCSRCGDYLPDQRALVSHQATGFCRPKKTTQERRTLRVGRQVEEKQKAERARRVVPATLQTFDGSPIKTSGVFKYLGSQVDSSASMSTEINRRTGIARTVVVSLRDIWRDNELPRRLKATLYQTLVNSVALYNAELWAPKESDMKTLRWFQHTTLRTVAGEKREWQMDLEEETEEREYASRQELCRTTGIPPIETMLREKRIVWATHTARNPGEACHFSVKAEIRAGSRWGRMVAADMEMVGMDVQETMKAPPDAKTVKAQLLAKRPTKPLAKEGRKETKRGKTKACAEKTQRQRENIRKQAEEQDQQRAQFCAQISGRRWVRVPDGDGRTYETEEENPVRSRYNGRPFAKTQARKRRG